MYTEFYGFREKPFKLIPDPSFLYMSSKHRMALTYLEYALMDGIGFVLLTGEIGAGKTTIIKKLLTQLEKDVEVAVVFNTNVSPEQLIEFILQEFELKLSERGKTVHLDTLNQFLIRKYSQDQRVVLIVDEAQNLSHEALEEVRMISNLQSDKEALLQIVLVGQPGLQAKLRHPSLAQLRQRIAVSYHLAPLSLEETREYVGHRLQMSGSQNNGLFSSEAVECVFQHSGGIPRTINILCDAALLYGYADELPTIDRKVMEHVLNDRREIGRLPALAAKEEIGHKTERVEVDATVFSRLQNLEERLAKLSAMMDLQILESERREERYKDILVDKLERLLKEERKRSETLSVRYHQLKEKMNSFNRTKK